MRIFVMKKYVEFTVTLLVLIASIACLGYVVVKAAKNGGDFFGSNAKSIVESQTKKKTSTSKDGKTVKSADSGSDDGTSGTILIGDSRFVGMNEAASVEDKENHIWMVAKVGQGLPWFKSTALKSVDKIKSRNTAITSWKYVICLGVNDLSDIDGYIEEYESLVEDDSSVKLTMVSVNPVQNRPDITNKDVQKFNDKLIDACDENDWKYIDTYDELIKKGYKTTDGLHYDDDTYKLIWRLIKKEM
jgi:hypothetical protein